jgi:hypothetical protein
LPLPSASFLQAVTEKLWTIYLNALKTSSISTLAFTVSPTTGDPHVWVWKDAIKRGCDGQTEAQCWVLAGDDRADYADSLAEFKKSNPNLKLTYEVPEEVFFLASFFLLCFICCLFVCL